MSSTNSLRGVLSLSVGTAVTRGLALCTQLLLVIWLAPAEFGYWAAASSAMAFVTGLVNFGEVNGYLANSRATMGRTRRVIIRLNVVLVIAGLVISGFYLYAGDTEVAILGLLIAVSIPIQGDSDLMYAAGVKSRQYGLLIWAQSMGAALKLVVAVAIAFWSESAMALAISFLAYYIVVDITILSRLKKANCSSSVVAPAPRHRQRFSWAVNSYMMTLPLQSAYLVSQFLASPEIIGILYLSFQITLGISGVISQPLARVALSAFASLQGVRRAETAMTFMHIFSAGMSGIVAIGILVLPLVKPWLGHQWIAAVPATLALLVSLTPRIVAPIIDGFQQSSGRWWQATSFNAVDAIGTGIASCTAVVGDVVLLAISISAWKALFGIGRFLVVMREVERAPRLGFTLLLVVATMFGFVAVLGSDHVRIVFAVLLLILGVAWSWWAQRHNLAQKRATEIQEHA